MANSFQACRPRFGILENVDVMSRPEEDDANVRHLNETFRGMGYAVAATTMNSLCFMVPQKRLRALCLVMDHQVFGWDLPEAEKYLEGVLARAKEFGDIQGKLDAFLLPIDHPRLLKELHRRQATTAPPNNNRHCKFLAKKPEVLG